MGYVYLAQDLRLPRMVALKTLRPGGFYKDESLRRFGQEARAASALNHPNILTIYEVGESAGVHFIASEFVEGPTIRQRLRGGKLPAPEAIGIAIQIARGLAAAHDAGIVHRDIKPENIIVRTDGLVKILDFGIAKLTGDRKHPAHLDERFSTGAGKVLGTARYMSPEQARGLEVDHRTDIFSLGAVIYEMVRGQAPFEGDTDSDLIAAILKTEPPALDSGAPRQLNRIVAKAIHKNRELRYQSAAELASDLTDLKSGASPYRRVGLVLAMLALAILTVPAGLYLWKAHGNKPALSGAPHSLAILPFRNIRQDPATDFLGFSLADAVITKLGYVKALTIRPSASVDKYRNRTIDPRRAGAELNVDTLLMGSFIRDGDRLRINAQLVDARNVRVIWEDSIDVRYENLFSVQDRVAERIIDGLAVNLSPAEAGNVRFDNPIGAQAYEDYLRGVNLYALNDFSSAIAVLESSAREEPGYALTWAHLGRAYTTNASLQFGGNEQYEKAQAAYRKAIALNPALLEPRVYMANLLTDTGHAEEAVPLLETALRINGNSAEAHWELGYAFRFAGLLSESLRECERARRIDPEVKLRSSALNTYLYLGEYDRFISSLPADESAYILFYRGFAEYYQHDYPRAAGHFDRSFALDPSLLQAEVGEALADAIRGRAAAGIQVLRETERRIRERGVSDGEAVYKLSEAYAQLGDDASAVRMAREAVDRGFFCYPYFESDPLIFRIRGRAEFAPVMALARRRHEEFRSRFGGVEK